MTRRLTVLQHHPVEGVGELGLWAHRHGIALDIHRADLGELPLVTSGRCVLLGGPYAVNSPPDWLKREQVWLHDKIALRTPILGICLGAQLLANGLGGRVQPLARPETGWTTIDFSDGSQVDALQWHEDAWTLPPGGRALASSKACAGQMFEIGAVYTGMQFHPEWDAAIVAALNVHFGAESPLPRQVDFAKHERMAAWFQTWLNGWWSSCFTDEQIETVPDFGGGAPVA